MVHLATVIFLREQNSLRQAIVRVFAVQSIRKISKKTKKEVVPAVTASLFENYRCVSQAASPASQCSGQPGQPPIALPRRASGPAGAGAEAEFGAVRRRTPRCSRCSAGRRLRLPWREVRFPHAVACPRYLLGAQQVIGTY